MLKGIDRPNHQRKAEEYGVVLPRATQWCVLAFAQYCNDQLCMVYGIQRDGAVGVGDISRNGRVITLQ